nr:unnamed protein product [Callosobruchus chinensis]
MCSDRMCKLSPLGLQGDKTKCFPITNSVLQHTARQHSGKLALDSLLIKPIQKFPKYELLLQRLIKHTDESHPDHDILLEAQRKIHDLLVKINCTEKEAVKLDQLREIEGLVDGY